MVKLWIDQTLVYVSYPEKLPAFLDEISFNHVLIPRKLWSIVYPILTKKGFAISSVKIIEGEAYDEWVCEG